MTLYLVWQNDSKLGFFDRELMDIYLDKALADKKLNELRSKYGFNYFIEEWFPHDENEFNIVIKKRLSLCGV
jgi:hypothetical protein